MSPSTVKGNIYYYSPKFKDSPASKNVKEAVILEQIEKVFQKMIIPDYVMKDLKESLKTTHEAKNKYKIEAKEKILTRYKNIDRKLDNLLNMRIDESITQEIYDKKASSLQQEKKDLEVRIKQFDNADDKFAITVQYLLELSSRAYDLFKSSKPQQKRQPINFVLSNLALDGEKLHYDLNKPFDAILQLCEIPVFLFGLPSELLKNPIFSFLKEGGKRIFSPLRYENVFLNGKNRRAWYIIGVRF
jgi:hypothetical protein